VIKAVLVFSILVISSLLFSCGLYAQSSNWYHGSVTAETPYNIGTDDLYSNILKDKKGSSVVVAVITMVTSMMSMGGTSSVVKTADKLVRTPTR
jgi:hypothetical protein